MTSSNNRTHHRSSAGNEGTPYFIVTITNYPELVRRTQRFQRSHQDSYQRCQGAMLMPGVSVHFGTSHPEDQEQLLYNTLRFRIQRLIQDYIQQTQRVYPIYLVFDMCDIMPHV